MSEPVLEERQKEEPTRRWEDRCHALGLRSAEKVAVCDRLRGHRGLHAGRLIYVSVGQARPDRVLCYVRW